MDEYQSGSRQISFIWPKYITTPNLQCLESFFCCLMIIKNGYKKRFQSLFSGCCTLFLCLK